MDITRNAGYKYFSINDRLFLSGCLSEQLVITICILHKILDMTRISRPTRDYNIASGNI